MKYTELPEGYIWLKRQQELEYMSKYCKYWIIHKTDLGRVRNVPCLVRIWTTREFDYNNTVSPCLLTECSADEVVLFLGIANFNYEIY